MELPEDQKFVIASGPVIIENNKVLLVKENKNNQITPWFFPGGRIKIQDKNLEETCKRECLEEVGLEIKIIKPLKPVMLKMEDKIIILIHFLAERNGEIKTGDTVIQYDWFDTNNLPDDCGPNVYEVINSL